MTSEVRKCPKMGFCAVYRPPRTPYGKRYLLQKYGTYESPWRTTYQKISQLPGCQTRHFWEKHVFLNFSRFLQKYRISIYISIIYAPKEVGSISLVWQGVAGNYGVLIFFSSHQVDELQNQKCGTHIKKLTAMKFQNSKNISYGSNKLGKVYLKKN